MWARNMSGFPRDLDHTGPAVWAHFMFNLLHKLPRSQTEMSPKHGSPSSHPQKTQIVTQQQQCFN